MRPERVVSVIFNDSKTPGSGLINNDGAFPKDVCRVSQIHAAEEAGVAKKQAAERLPDIKRILGCESLLYVTNGAASNQACDYVIASGRLIDLVVDPSLIGRT